jgi:tetratricopeptide (TPR) repeat protein
MKRCLCLVLIAGAAGLAGCGLPDPAARHNNQGNRAFESEQYEEARDRYVDAQRENADLAEPYYNVGNTFYRTGDLESAIAQTQQSLRLADDELSQQAYYNLGNNHFQIQDWANAVEAYKEALRRNPDDADAKHNLELALQVLSQQQQQQGANGDPNQEPSDQQAGASGLQEPEEAQGPQPIDLDDLSPEAARQLLNALLQDSQTLQERLQDRFVVPGPAPSKDW